ncbi:MAG: DUF2269 domain-containing protein, partial [Magnetococcales bacterium]|nr:DUF2269 domain-containing protein [Magnetococcales bacterium]
WMVWILNYDITSRWLWVVLGLYVLIGMCWLPVVWLQIRMQRMAAHAVAHGEQLSPLYYRYFRIWFTLGWPAFLSVLVIFYLMIYKPDL